MLAHGRFTGTGRRHARAQFVDRILEQMHRRTLTILRHEVRPVPFPVYATLWRAAAASPPGDAGPSGGALLRVLQQSGAGRRSSGASWNADVLPLRLASYDPAELASLSERRIALDRFRRRRPAARTHPPALPRRGQQLPGVAARRPVDLSEDARAIYAFLKGEGVLFPAELAAGVGLAETALDL